MAVKKIDPKKLRVNPPGARSEPFVAAPIIILSSPRGGGRIKSGGELPPVKTPAYCPATEPAHCPNY